MSKRHGERLSLSTIVLFFEMVVGWVLLTTAQSTQESYYTSSGLGPAVFFLPVVVGLVALPGAVLSVLLVLPTLSLAGWVGRRSTGRDAWWWILPVAVAVTAGLAAGLWAVFGGRFTTALRLWLFAAAALICGALAVHAAVRRWESRGPGRMFRPTALAGVAAVILTIAASVAASEIGRCGNCSSGWCRGCTAEADNGMGTEGDW